jgi:hypothetical protein
MYYNVLLFLLPTTKLRFTGRLDPGKVFPRINPPKIIRDFKIRL